MAYRGFGPHLGKKHGIHLAHQEKEKCAVLTTRPVQSQSQSQSEKPESISRVHWTEKEIEMILADLADLVLVDPTRDINVLFRGPAQAKIDNKRRRPKANIRDFRARFLQVFQQRLDANVRVERVPVEVQVEKPLVEVLDAAPIDMLFVTAFRRQQQIIDHLSAKCSGETLPVKEMVKEPSRPTEESLVPPQPPPPPPPKTKTTIAVLGGTHAQQRHVEEKIRRLYPDPWVEFRWHQAGNGKSSTPNVDGCDLAVINSKFDRHGWEDICRKTVGRSNTFTVYGGITQMVEILESLISRLKIARLRNENRIKMGLS